MRSPFGVRFPAAAILLSVAMALSSCTSGDSDPYDPPGSSAAPAREARSDPSEQATEGGGRDQEGGAATSVADADSKRTVTGTAPAYVEIAEAGIVGTNDRLILQMTLSGSMPKRMPDESSALRISFRLKTRTGRTFTFDAHCVRSGWGTFATGGPEEFRAPQLSLAGDTLELHIDPTYMDGLRTFDWIATVTWSGAGGDYAFDVAPKTGVAAYP